MMKLSVFSIAIPLLMASCATTGRLTYFSDMQPESVVAVGGQQEICLRPGDKITIVVSSKDQKLADLFNLTDVAAAPDSGGGERAERRNALMYTVDSDGNIDFPILGKLHVEGMKVSEVTDMIKQKIEQGNYMKDPLVSIEFLNFKYTVLGAVGRNGTFSADGDRITLLEAIANAGDLAVNAQIDRVAVIRETDGERQMFMHDLRSTDLFESPCFYLQQNDIVYVEPKYKKKDKEDRGWQIVTTVLSLVTAVCSVIWATR